MKFVHTCEPSHTFTNERAHLVMNQRRAVGMPGGGRRRSMPTLSSGHRAERVFRVAFGPRVHTNFRITPGDPIAPDGPGYELADSRCEGVRVPNRSATQMFGSHRASQDPQTDTRTGSLTSSPALCMLRSLCRCQDYDKILTVLMRGAEYMRQA